MERNNSLQILFRWGRLVTCRRVANPPTKFALLPLNYRKPRRPEADGRRLTTGAQAASLPYKVSAVAVSGWVGSMREKRYALNMTRAAMIQSGAL